MFVVSLKQIPWPDKQILYDYCIEVGVQHQHLGTYFNISMFTAALMAIHCPK